MRPAIVCRLRKRWNRATVDVIGWVTAVGLWAVFGGNPDTLPGFLGILGISLFGMGFLMIVQYDGWYEFKPWCDT